MRRAGAGELFRSIPQWGSRYRWAVPHDYGGHIAQCLHVSHPGFRILPVVRRKSPLPVRLRHFNAETFPSAETFTSQSRQMFRLRKGFRANGPLGAGRPRADRRTSPGGRHASLQSRVPHRRARRAGTSRPLNEGHREYSVRNLHQYETVLCALGFCLGRYHRGSPRRTRACMAASAPYPGQPPAATRLSGF